MTPPNVDDKALLTTALAKLNADVLQKLEGLDEYDLRRPLTPTGSNLLGIVKHLASVQGGYLGSVFGHHWDRELPWLDDPTAEINADMFATAEQSSGWIVDLYRESWAHASQTIANRALQDTGTVPWWPPERRHPTLAEVLVHLTVETARHVGHLDLIRELIDGQAGRFAGDQSLPGDDEIDWRAYHQRVLDEAKRAAGGP